MAGKQSKDKGKSGERELCKLLEKYLGGNFERTDASGAFIGGKNFYRKDKMTETQIRSAKSDIFPPDHLPKLVTECKWYKDFPYHQLVMGNDTLLLDGWIKDLEHDCDDDDIGLLCIKINHKGWMICFHSKLASNFSIKNYVMYKDYIVTGFDLFFKSNKDDVAKLCS